jgi:hypothetical protein
MQIVKISDLIRLRETYRNSRGSLIVNIDGDGDALSSRFEASGSGFLVSDDEGNIGASD